MNKSRKTNTATYAKHPYIFKAITILIPFLILFAFEGVLRLSNYGDNLDLFVRNETPGYEDYMMVNPEIGKKYFQKLEHTLPQNDIFYTKKPANTFRIFVMGSSTVYGFPYNKNLMFSRILNEQLEAAYPGTKIEVINTAMTAINSYTLLDFTKQILKYNPDAILIYAGHNEYYGAMGVGSNETMSKNRNLTLLHISLMDYKLYQLVRKSIYGLAQKLALVDEARSEGTLMKRIVENNNIQYGSKEYNIGIESYKRNMDDILRKITKKHIPVFYSEVVCNVKDLKPFGSIAGNTSESANDVYEKACMAEANGDYEKAKDLYYKAKDLDGIRFRASEDINRIINELSEKYHVHRVPMLAIFQKNSPNGLIGDNLMTEHVHPNIDGQFLLADAFYSKIIETGIIGNPVLTNRSSREYVRRNYGYTKLDSLTAYHRIQMLKGSWPFVKVDEEIKYSLIYKPKNYLDSLAFEVIRNDSLSSGNAHYQLAQMYNEDKDYSKAFMEYNAALKTYPFDALLYRDAATVLINLEDLPLALKYLLKSLEYEESGFACFKIAEIYFYMGNYKESLVFLQKALPLVPKERKILILAQTYAAYMLDNNVSAAQNVANKLKEMNAEEYIVVPAKEYYFDRFIPFQTRDEVLLAKQLVSEHRLSEALSILEASLSKYDSHIANRLIGEIYVRMGKVQTALSFYEKIYTLFRYDPKYLYELTLIYHSINEYDKANECLQEFKNIDPANRNLNTLESILSKTN